MEVFFWRHRRAPVSRRHCSPQTEEAARQAGRGRGRRRRHGGEMHHLSVDTGGGGGCQVMAAPVGFQHAIALQRAHLGWQVWLHFYYVFWGMFLCLKTQRYSNQPETPEALKITSLMKLHFWLWLFLFFHNHLLRIFLPSVSLKRCF